MLHSEGINSVQGIINYLKWAKTKGVNKVVIRKIQFNNNWTSYQIAKKHNVTLTSNEQNMIKNKFKDFVEFDFESCEKNNSNLILRSDGNIYSDWDSSIPLSQENFLLSYLNKISKTSTCLGRKVSAIIISNKNEILGIGSNSGSPCLQTKVCNRVIHNKNSDYSMCLATHAEISAIQNALRHNNKLTGAKLYLYGHHTICSNCLAEIKKYNLDYEIIK